MNLSTVAIKNPIPIFILFIAMTIAGIYGFKHLVVTSFPDMDFPTITVTVTMPGASPEQIQNQITTRIEDSIANIGGIKHITSTISDGNSNTNIEFDLNIDINSAINEVKYAVDTIKSQLPSGTNEPQVNKIAVGTHPILTYQIIGNMDITDLSWYVDNQINQLLRLVPGVSKIVRHGGVEREIQVLLDPNKLITTGATINNVASQFYNMQQAFSGGRVELGGREFTIETKPKINNINDISELYIPLSNSSYIQLGQIAKILDTHSEVRQMAFVNGRKAVTFDVYPIKGVSEIDVTNKVREGINNYIRLHPDIKIQEISNGIDSIQDIYTGSMQAIIEGAILAIIVICFFYKTFVLL